MVRTRTWTIEINITEHEDGRRTDAGAILQIGDKPATVRALADLAGKLLDVVAADIDRPAHRPMRILS